MDDVVVAFNLLVDDSRFIGMWRSDDDIQRILKSCYGVDVSSKTINKAMTTKFAPNNIIDSEDVRLNTTSVVRHRFTVWCDTPKQKKKKFFYYIRKNSKDMPEIHSDGSYWQHIYDTVIYRIHTRSRNPECKEENNNKKNCTALANQDDHDDNTFVVNFDNNTWTTSKNTRAIFGVSKDVNDVRLFLSERIVDLESVINMEKPIASILTTPEWECTKQLSEKQIMYYRDRAMYLHLAYCIALDGHFISEKKDAGFQNCCEMAIEQLSNVGFKTISNPRTIMRWNQEYRIAGKFHHPYETIKLTEPKIFHAFPEAVPIARKALSDIRRKGELNTDKAQRYFQKELINLCMSLEIDRAKSGVDDDDDDVANDIDILVNVSDEERKRFLKKYNLKTITHDSTCHWLGFLGFKYEFRGRSFYSDGHERPENVLARKKFIKQYQEDEIRKYKWVQLTENQVNVLKGLPKGPLSDSLPYHQYTSLDGQTMREYNVYDHDKFIDFVSEPNKTSHGGDLSVRINGCRPIIENGQDETVIEQNSASKLEWKGPGGETTALPKGAGQTKMISSFTGPSLGFGYSADLTEQGRLLTNQLRMNKSYYCTSSAMEVLGSTSKKSFESIAAMKAVLCTLFDHGIDREGYWNNAHAMIQTEDAIDILKGRYPGHDFDFIYDQSSGHTKHRFMGLNVAVMNKSYGGVQPPMRDTIVCQDCLGNFDPWLSVGDTQCMQFTENDKGPFELLSDEERISKKYDKKTGKNITVKRKKPKLLNELRNKGLVSCRGKQMKEVEQMCIAHNIPLHDVVEEIVPGWLGKPKGILQVLRERGKLDTSQLAKYSMSPRKQFVDEDGNIKEEFKKFILPDLLAACPDFRDEQTALEHLCETCSDDNCKIRMIFSPKYHCEIAGLGIELVWGCLKKFYRRYITFNEKKQNFDQCVTNALTHINRQHCRKFNRRVRRYMMAYDYLTRSNDEASFAVIEKFVKKSTIHRSALNQDTAVIDEAVAESIKSMNLFGT